MHNLMLQPATHMIDSREVADMVEKRHDHLIRDIEVYISAMNQNPNLRNATDTYFQASSYTTQPGGRAYKCFLVTRMGTSE